MDIGGGASATTRAAREFAQSASLKVSGGAGKTRTQHIVEQRNAQASSDLKAGRATPVLASGLLSELTKLQAARK